MFIAISSGKNQLAGYEVKQRFYEIGSPDGLAELDSLLRRPNGCFIYTMSYSEQHLQETAQIVAQT